MRNLKYLWLWYPAKIREELQSLIFIDVRGVFIYTQLQDKENYRIYSKHI